MFVEQLLTLNYRGTLSAKSVCVLAYFAVEAGAVGPAEDLGCRPAAGHFHHPLQRRTRRNFVVRVPGHDGLENDRVVTEIPFVLPHESIEEELAPTVDAVDTLATKCREQEFPKRISSIQQYARVHWHCVVAVPVRGRDSVLNGGQYLGDLLGEPRNRLPKTGSCMCGCKGWCSIFCVAEFVKWSCLAMTSGMWPTACHDGKLWRGDSDEARSQFAGTPLGSSA